MSTLDEADHRRLRRAEEAWLRQSTERLRAAATIRRTTAGRPTEDPEQTR